MVVSPHEVNVFRHRRLEISLRDFRLALKEKKQLWNSAAFLRFHFCRRRLRRLCPRLLSSSSSVSSLAFLTFCPSERSTLPFGPSHLCCVLARLSGGMRSIGRDCWCNHHTDGEIHHPRLCGQQTLFCLCDGKIFHFWEQPASAQGLLRK